MRKARTPKPKIVIKHAVSKDMKEIAQDLIGDLCGVLKDVPIEYILKTRTNSDTGKSVDPKVGECLGPVQAANAVDRDIHKRGFRVILSGNWWEKATKEDRRAAVHYQLCRCAPVNGKPTVAKPDFVGFESNVRHFGCWTDSLKGAQKVMPQQLTLLGEDTPAAETKKRGRGGNAAHVDVAQPHQHQAASGAASPPPG